MARLTCLDPDQVARCAIEKLLAREPVIIPGFANRIIVAAGRVAPRSLVFAVARAYWGRTATTPAAAERRLSERAAW